VTNFSFLFLSSYPTCIGLFGSIIAYKQT
jgi:hypothetical protein